MPETTESTPLETTATEQVQENPQETTSQSEQPVTTEAAPETVAEAQPPVQEEAPKPFHLPVAEQQVEAQPSQPDLTEIQPEIIAELFKDKKEVLLKAFGLDEFVLGALDYYQKTGSLAEYAEVKSVDYTKVPDTEIVARKLREQYAGSNLSEEDLNLLVDDELNSRFKTDEELYSERDVQLGKIRLKAEAAEYRKTLIDRQAQFRAPERAAETQAKVDAPQPTYEQVVEQSRTKVMEDQSVQQFLQARKIALGTENPYNYEVQNPQEALAMVYDNNRYIYQVAQKNDKGEVLMRDGQPVMDYSKLIKVANYIQNMEAIENGLINHGRTLGKKAILDEAENVQTNQTYGAVKEPDDLFSALNKRLVQG
jgi:hypothetical protein